MKQKILIATHNLGKLAEIKSFLSDNQLYEFLSLTDLNIYEDIEETGSTFEENAILKARHFSKLSGLPTLGDDSGLEIDALDGEPGIYSSRYAGEQATEPEKVAYVLKKMEQVPDEMRQGRFRTVLAMVSPSGKLKTYEGTVEGIILREAFHTLLPGLPYCSILQIPKYGKSLAELKTAQIMSASPQRIRALENWLDDLPNFFA